MDESEFKDESMVRGLWVSLGLATVEERPAAGKTILDPMPMADRRFTEPPAKKYHFRPQHTGKIDEALLHPLADAAVVVDLFDPIFDFVHEPQNFLVLLEPVHQIRCGWIELLLANDGFAFVLEPPNIFQDPFNQRTHRRQQSIGFIHRKQARKSARGVHTKVALEIQCLCADLR
jgi:hypothetical protein